MFGLIRDLEIRRGWDPLRNRSGLSGTYGGRSVLAGLEAEQARKAPPTRS